MNDLCDRIIGGKIITFADDTVVMFEGERKKAETHNRAERGILNFICVKAVKASIITYIKKFENSRSHHLCSVLCSVHPRGEGLGRSRSRA